MSDTSATDLVFWDPSGYRFNSATDWNQWRYVADGLGGQIGIRFGASPGFGTFDWDTAGGKAPAGSLADSTGSGSFGKHELAGMTSSSVNAIRMQTNQQFIHPVNNYTIELDFSQYKGSKAGGKDGVAGANTFVGVSDIYAGLTHAKTVITISGTLADGSAGSPAGWTLFNGGAMPSTAQRNEPGAQLSLVNGVLQGTNRPAPGGLPNTVDTVLGLVRLDAAGYKTLLLRYDISPVGNHRVPRTDNSGLYVATAIPRQPAPPPVVEKKEPPPVEKKEPPPVEKKEPKPEEKKEPPPPVTEEKCRVKTVVSTTTLLTSVLERLNRRSVVQLLEQIISEVNAHCEKQLGPTINITEVTQQIELLSAKLLLIQSAAKELDTKDLVQIEELLQKLLLKIDLGSVVQNIQIQVDGRSFQLQSLLEVLSTLDQVVTVQLLYAETDPEDISGAIFILSDHSHVVFSVRTVQQLGPDRITYIFESANWKGLPAAFSMVFRRHTRSFKLCNRMVSVDSFDVVEQTNIVFDLCTRIRKGGTGTEIPPPPFDEGCVPPPAVESKSETSAPLPPLDEAKQIPRPKGDASGTASKKS